MAKINDLVDLSAFTQDVGQTKRRPIDDRIDPELLEQIGEWPAEVRPIAVIALKVITGRRLNEFEEAMVVDALEVQADIIMELAQMERSQKH